MKCHCEKGALPDEVIPMLQETLAPACQCRCCFGPLRENTAARNDNCYPFFFWNSFMN
jgi:hypothetical protein